MIMTPLAHIARAQKISVILAREQEPFWMTGGSIALSNLGTAPPAEAKWWWSERIRHRLCATHRGPLSIDAFTDEPIWQDPALCSGTGNEFSASRAAEILKDFLETPRYRQMVRSFSRLASLETDLTELEKLKAEAEQGLADVVVYVREGAYLTDSEVEQLLEFNHAPPFWPDYWIQTNSYPKTNVVFWISKDGRYSMDSMPNMTGYSAYGLFLQFRM